MIGRTLSHYRILEKLGSGGMGDVYVAHDTELDRKIALKVLPPELAESDERRARFQREAKALAALNHPNIVTAFSVEKADSVHFITMELVCGKTLTELLRRNGFALKQFFDIAIPLADAVAAAHEQGITHRDLKPDNVMVSEEGRVKVLDFGLARPTRGFVEMGKPSELPTQARTEEGAIVGTIDYMSPEQAEGKPVDDRSDIFSLGIIFYEMLTGERPFRGDSVTSVLSSIIKDTPESITNFKPGIPRELAKIVRRCLAKEPRRRPQTALDLCNELEELKSELGSGELREVSPRPTSRNRWRFPAALLLLMLVGAGIYFVGDPRRAVPRLINPIQVTSAVGVENYPTWSPDGGRLAYEANQSGHWDIWITQLGGGAPVNLTEDHDGDANFPSWSPDGRQIAFLAERDQTWALYTMSALGGDLRRMTALQYTTPLGPPQWSTDGMEVAISDQDGAGNFAQIVSLRTQEASRLPLPSHEGNPCRDLAWSPDGRTFAYVDAIPAAEITQLWVFAASGAEPIPVTDGQTNDWSPTWSADGRTLFFVSNRGGSLDLWQQRISRDGRPEGKPEPVTTGLEIRSVDFSPDGTKLAYSRGRWVANIWRVPILAERQATWGDAEQITFDNAFLQFFDLSPDGKNLVVSSDRAGNQDLWVLPSDGGEMSQLTTDPTPDWMPRWSPDETEIVFYAYRSGNRDLWVMPSGGGPARQITFHPSADTYPAWSPHGRQIAFDSWRSGNRDVWVTDAQGGEPRQVTATPGPDVLTTWSPDGQSLLIRGADYRLRLYPIESGEPELVTRNLASGPAAWSPDGKVLYFLGHRVPQVWARSLENGREHSVADLGRRRGTLGADLSTDGSYLYFCWRDDLGDLWVMDVVEEP